WAKAAPPATAAAVTVASRTILADGVTTLPPPEALFLWACAHLKRSGIVSSTRGAAPPRGRRSRRRDEAKAGSSQCRCRRDVAVIVVSLWQTRPARVETPPPADRRRRDCSSVAQPLTFHEDFRKAVRLVATRRSYFRADHSASRRSRQ